MYKYGVGGEMNLGGWNGLNLLEVHVLELEVDFDDARCLDPGTEDVLLRQLLVFGAQAV